MPYIRLTASAAAAVAVVLALALSPATARPCDHGDAGCVVSPQADAIGAQADPMKLDQFIKTWKPVAKPESGRDVQEIEEVEIREKACCEGSCSASLRLRKQRRHRYRPKPLRRNPDQSVATDAVGITPSTKRMRLMRQTARRPATSRWWPSMRSMSSTWRRLPRPFPPKASGNRFLPSSRTRIIPGWAKLLLAIAGTIALAGATRFFVA